MRFTGPGVGCTTSKSNLEGACYTCGMAPAQRHKVFRMYLITTLVSIAALVVLLVAHVYVRWFLNQEFSFLPGFGFEALVFLVLGELLGLVYLLKD